MRRTALVLALVFVVHAAATKPEEATPDERKGKLFSLFSVVTFKNQGCATNLGTTATGANRNGTCYTSSECSTKGGAASGNCAAGFGVCCFFAYDATATISENCTYIRNPGFPTASTGTTAITITVNKCATDVCSLRLDFESFDIRGASTTDESTDCLDSFQVTTTSSMPIPRICGYNTGQHIYADLGADSTDTASLAFTFDTTVTSGTYATSRTFEVKVTQIECSNPSRAPSGCLQYHTTMTGRLTTFNFDVSATARQVHLWSQEYSICIRQSSGMCCIEYTLCTDTSAWTLDGASLTASAADVGSNCSEDWVEIAGAAGMCGSTNYKAAKLCGVILSPVTKGLQTSPICTCEAPFRVGIVTNAAADAIAIAGTLADRGVCLNYQMLPCGNN